MASVNAKDKCDDEDESLLVEPKEKAARKDKWGAEFSCTDM